MNYKIITLLTVKTGRENCDYKTIYRKNLSGGRVATYDKANNELVITKYGNITTFFKLKFGSNVSDAGFNYYKGLK